MTLLNRKVDYALLILCSLQHRSEAGSAREIAEQLGLSRGFVANILKDLCQQWFVVSQRGVHGGYQLHPSAAQRTLADLLDALDSPLRLAECNEPVAEQCCTLAPRCPIRAPIALVHERLRTVLATVQLREIFDAPAPSAEPRPVLLEVSRCEAARAPA